MHWKKWVKDIIVKYMVGAEMITLRTIKFVMKDGKLIRVSDTINPNLQEEIEQLEKKLVKK